MGLSREEILRRAQKLMSFTEGNATAGEVENAAAMLGNLLRENNLSLEDIRVEAMRGDIEEQECQIAYWTIPGWYLRLSGWIAEATNCRTIVLTQPDGSHMLRIYGHKADAAVAAYFLEVTARTLPKIAKNEKPANHKSYMLGLVDGVGQRLVAMVKPVDAPESERAIILVKDKAVDEHFESKHPANTREVIKRNNNVENLDDYTNGKKKADDIALNHGVRHQPVDGPRLTGG